jgi:hypothetical protein
MKHHSTRTSVLLALLISAGLATAQTTTTPTFESAVTTGMVGFMPSTQTAQLNVLNIGGVFAATTGTTSTNVVAACPVELEIYDGQNNVLKSLQVSNVTSGTEASLTFKLSDLPAGTVVFRLDIRGVVRSNPIVTGPIPAAGTPILPAVFSSCSFVTTLELFDTSTGITQTLTSDTRPFGSPVVVPLAVRN